MTTSTECDEAIVGRSSPLNWHSSFFSLTGEINPCMLCFLIHAECWKDSNFEARRARVRFNKVTTSFNVGHWVRWKMWHQDEFIQYPTIFSVISKIFYCARHLWPTKKTPEFENWFTWPTFQHLFDTKTCFKKVLLKANYLHMNFQAELLAFC